MPGHGDLRCAGVEALRVRGCLTRARTGRPLTLPTASRRSPLDINHSVPAADEPIARARPGSLPRDLVPARRHDAKPSATQAAEAWFPSACGAVASFLLLEPAPIA